MRTTMVARLLATTSLATGCVSQTTREDALWRELRTSTSAPSTTTAIELLGDTHELDRAALITAVLARNPTVAAAREAARASLTEIRQVTALDDPRLGYDFAPLSIASDAVRYGQRITLRQKLPFPGKRRLAGEAALALAEADAAEVEVVRLELAQLASELYDAYYVVARALEINAHHRTLLDQIKKSAEAQYVAGRAAQQDPIQAEVELAQLERERLALASERDQLVARMHGLLHLPPGSGLPGPPATLALPPAPAGTSAELQALALRQRPQRSVISARRRAARARVAVAERDFYPDFEVMGSYDSMWAMTQHQWMLGVMVELPLQRAPRAAAVEQAQAQVARTSLEDARLVDDIRVEVDRAHRRVAEAEAVVGVYADKLVPAARTQVDAARAGFISAQNSFPAVVEAQNDLRELELRLEIARADLSRRRAELAKAVGFIPGLPQGGAP